MYHAETIFPETLGKINNRRGTDESLAVYRLSCTRKGIRQGYAESEIRKRKYLRYLARYIRYT